MSRERRKEITPSVRIPVSDALMFRIPNSVVMERVQMKATVRPNRKDSSSGRKKSIDMSKPLRMDSKELKKFCAAHMDILQATSYFPEPRVVPNKTYDYKTPERLVGVYDNRPYTVFDRDYSATESICSTGTDTSPFQAEMLSIHNRVRYSHNVPLLKLDKDLCILATKRAALLVSNGKVEDIQAEGINVYSFIKLKRSTEAAEACDSWYKEGKKYPYDVQINFNANNCHFTQMIWADTSHLGVGMAKGNGKTYIVALYVPKGNISGKYPANVFKPR